MIDLQKSLSGGFFKSTMEKQAELASGSDNLDVFNNDFINTLYASLDFSDLMQTFMQEVRIVLECDGIEYNNIKQHLYFIDGVLAKHRCAYDIIFGEQDLGNICFSRDRLFMESELQTIENMVAGLALPLRNSVKYHQAIQVAQDGNMKDLGNNGSDISENKNEPISRTIYEKLVEELLCSRREAEKLKEQLNESRNKMLRDALTGLPNRAAYDERIVVEESRIRRNKMPLCLAVWDIDYFKNVNDTYGHDVGDRVLKHFSEIIRKRLRKVDLFARIGGEEFVLVMPDTSLKKALELNNRLRDILEKSDFHVDGKRFPVTASVGIAAFNDEDCAEAVLKKADVALYQSKKTGRNRCTVYFESKRDAHIDAQLSHEKVRRA